MRRLYFLAPNNDIAKAIVTELAQSMDIPERHIHAVSHATGSIETLPEASLLQKSEVKYGFVMGLCFGGVAGLWGALLAIMFPPAPMDFQPEFFLIISTLVGAIFGALVSIVVTTDVPNHELEIFRNAIRRGQVLLIVDIHKNALDDVVKIFHRHHPHADIKVMSITS